MYTYPNGKTAQQVYDELHRTQNYGRSHLGHGRDLERYILPCKSLLDVGCGRCHFAWHVQQNCGVKIIQGCDLSPVAVNWQKHRGLPCVVADLSEGLPFDDSSYEAVTAFDVLEHIQPRRVLFAISELARVASKVALVTIAHGRADKGLDKEALHLTVKPPEYWRDKMIDANVKASLLAVRKSNSVWSINAAA